MDFRQHDDTIIELRLTDRRGRPVRAAVCHDLKIRVWTQDPRCYISIYPRDIRTEGPRDFLMIPDWQMAALQPGVIVYSYSFREPIYEPHGHMDHRGHHDDFEKKETVVTSIHWHGMHMDHLPSNPVNAHSLEHLRRIIEDVEVLLLGQIRDIKRYVEKEYTNELDKEKDRAKEAEEDLRKDFAKTYKRIGKELQRLGKNDTAFLTEVGNLKKEITGLRNTLASDKDENKASADALEKKIIEKIAKAEKKVKDLLKTLNTKLNKALNNIESLKNKAKLTEQRLDGRIDNLEDTIKNLRRAHNDLESISVSRSIFRDEIKRLEHLVEDAKHYADDEVHKLRESIVPVKGETIQGWFK